MLQNIREKFTGTFALVVLVLLAIPFVFVGVGANYSFFGASSAAVVDGEEISLGLFEARYRDVVENNPTLVSADEAQRLQVRRQILDNLVYEQLIENYLNEHFQPFLDRVLTLYRLLFDRVTTAFPGLHIFCHGYDWAIPAGGRWLGKPLSEKGIEEPALQRGIIRVIIDRFNDAIAHLAETYEGRVHHVDCRGAVGGPGEWHDELHPTDEGYAKVAARFRRAINDVLIVTS